jgi:signal transduction histidine kinase
MRARKSYTVKEVLDKLADALLNQDDVGLLLQDSLQIYNSAIRPTFSSAYAVTQDGVLAQAGIGANDLLMDSDLINRIDPDIKVRPIRDLTDKILIERLSQHNIDLIDTTAREGKLNGIYLFGKSESGLPYSPKDIELLRISGKNLAVSIENAIRFRMIENFNEQLKLEVEIATNKLRVSNRKLISLDKTKDEFMSIASHQLRTPLTTVKNMIILLGNGQFGHVSNDQKQALKVAGANVNRMVSLIQDFLDASNITTGRFEIRRDFASVENVINEAVTEEKELAANKKIKMVVDVQKNIGESLMDRQKIKEVVLNYLDNAIQYTPEGKHVWLFASKDQDHIKVVVKDQGIGVAEDEQPGLFSKSFRGSNAKKDRPDGTGLGLFLAKKIIEAHKGEVIFSSKLNSGSVFGFTLPIN